MELKKGILLLLLLLEYVCCNVEAKCVKGCDVALASYYVSPGFLVLDNITRLMESSVLSNDVIISYNKDNIVNRTLLSLMRINIPFPCDCIRGEFLGHVFQYSAAAGDTYDSIAKVKYANLTTIELLRSFNSYGQNDIPANAMVNVTVNCSCGNSQVSKDYGLFITYPLRPGNSLHVIADKAHLDAQLLQSYNPGVNFSKESGIVFIPGRGLARGAVAGISIAGISGLLLLVICIYVKVFQKKEGEKPKLPTEKSLAFSTQDASGSTEYETSGSSGTATASATGLTGIMVAKSMEFTYQELAKATNNFSSENKIGQGGFGAVFYAELRGEKTAIKKMDVQASTEFLCELKVLTHVHHLNLVRLIGYCVEGSLFLVYEYIDNGNLAQYLHGTGKDPFPWSSRVQIALDSARGLEYIHEHTVPVYIHRDVKSANILIDKHLRGKVADFGLTKLFEVGGSTLHTRLVGTFGYMPPEYAQYGDVSPKVDVYAFGVVLYELISAKNAVLKTGESVAESKGLVALFEEALNQSNPSEGIRKLVDPRLGENYPIDSVLKIAQLARACTRDNPLLRPSMRSIVVALMTLSSPTEDFYDASYENQTLINLLKASSIVSKTKRRRRLWLSEEDQGDDEIIRSATELHDASIRFSKCRTKQETTHQTGNDVTSYVFTNTPHRREMDFELRRAREKLEKEQRERKERARLKVQKERKAKEEAQRQKEALEAVQRSRRIDAVEAQLKADQQMQETLLAGRGIVFYRLLEAVPYQGGGDKIKLPPSCFTELSDQGAFDKGPIYFQLSLVHKESSSSFQDTNKDNQGTTHSGVLEFTADEGQVGLPPHVRNNLFSEGASESPLVEVRYVWLPKGTYAKLQPERVGFSDLPNHKAILETSLRQHATLSQGDILTVNYGELAYKLRVLELKPSSSVSVLETDIEVDIVDPDTSSEKADEHVLIPLAFGMSQSGTVEEGKFVYYKFSIDNNVIWEKLSSGNSCIEVKLESETGGGDTDLFISKHPLIFPTRHQHEWSSHDIGAKSLILSSKDKSLGTGTYSIGIYGFKGLTKYKISAVVRDNFNQKVGQQASSSVSSVEMDTEQCTNCKHYIPTRTIALHEAYCRRHIVVCQHAGCGVVLRIEEFKNHIHCDRCGQAFQQVELEKHMKVFHEPLHCPCGIVLEKEQMVEHQASVCPVRLITCQFCGDMVQAGNSAIDVRDRLRGLSEHESICGSRTAPCDSCGRAVMLKDMDIHHIAVHQNG
ncbi:unnamed protein product [Sphenostylis stenocarpa]|uniref:non-specific serine/threonine protein kinase n=1 Tax=Sphenostylis stenocarpa TaxID=92480 RepID=A0AA86SRF0_9FABA|nr:unnamed protein product [Sphenostylis stenocarpa]